jgi:thymidylate synthase (FAD)
LETTERSAARAEELFTGMGGAVQDGFPAIHAPVYRTAAGTAYLKTPGVVVLARPQTNVAGLSGFLEGFDPGPPVPGVSRRPTELPGSSQLCKTAGQLCYASFGPRRTRNENAAAYFERLTSAGHGSVLEHASFSFLLYGISRSVTHELVRHRAGAGFSQISQRYVSGSVLRFVERPEYQEDEELHRLFEERAERAAAEYGEMADRLLGRQEGGHEMLSADHKTDARKKVQQTARSLLPNETEAPMVFTGNVRALRHIIEMRADAHAESEIRNLALGSSSACEPWTHPLRRLRARRAPRRHLYRLYQEPQGVGLLPEARFPVSVFDPPVLPLGREITKKEAR